MQIRKLSNKNLFKKKRYRNKNKLLNQLEISLMIKSSLNQDELYKLIFS